MEAGRSFASLFPISQNQNILPCSKRALGKQEQMRKKEVQLQNQLQFICQRQRDAHRRNQDLLRDFNRIEQELSVLTAKSDSFRRRQEMYKNQLHPFISEQSNSAAANNITCTLGLSYIKQFNDIQAANYGNLCEPCHFSASAGHIVQPLTHFPLCPNQQLGLKGCCNRPLCCGLMHPHCDQRFIPDVCKILDSTLDCQSQKKNCPTKALSIPGNMMFIPNTKKDNMQHYPEFVCDKDSSLKCRATPTHAHRDPLQCILSSDMYNDCKDKLLKEVQQQMVEEHAVETSTERCKEDLNKNQACHSGPPNFISEYPQKPLDGLSKTHLPSVLPSNIFLANARKKNKQLNLVYKNPSYETTSGHKIGDAFCQEAQIKEDSHEMKLSLKLSNVSDSLISTGANEQRSNYKTAENHDVSKGQFKQEIEIKNSSSAESVHEEVLGYPDPNYLCSAGHLHQYEEKDAIDMLESMSREKDYVLRKGLKMFYTVQENENSSRCISSEDELQEESSVSSTLSGEENRGADNKCSAKGQSLEIKEQGLFSKMVQHNQSLCAGNIFGINEDKMKRMINTDTELESLSNDNSESQMEEITCDDKNVGMLMKENRLSNQSLSENTKTGDIYGVGGEKFRKMLIEEIEKSSSEEDRDNEEKSEAASSVHGRVCIFAVRERDTQRQVSINKESKAEESREDSTPGEDEKSVSSSQESCIVTMDEVIHELTEEQQSNTEVDTENKLTKKMDNQRECNTENNINSEEESTEADTSDEERLSSEGLNVSDETHSSEEEENTDFWGSRHEENDSDIEEMEKDEQLQTPSPADFTNQVNVAASTREEDPQEPATSVLDVTAANCQNLIADEEVNSEKQRSSWLCCLKTCSLPHILNKSSEHQTQGKRCSEDGSMDMLRMHPVEFESALPAEETPGGSIDNVHTEATSAADTNVEDSDEESLHYEKGLKNHNQPWSDSEDNVHSFFD